MGKKGGKKGERRVVGWKEGGKDRKEESPLWGLLGSPELEFEFVRILPGSISSLRGWMLTSSTLPKSQYSRKERSSMIEKGELLCL